MTVDFINPANQPIGVADEKISQVHIEAVTDSQGTGTPSEEWQEQKPKLNLQMALAFIVSLPTG
jgi:hypothetical protein